MIRRDPELRRLVDEAWRRLAGRPIAATDLTLEELRRVQWSPEFETMMRNRLLMGAFRYGNMRDRKKAGSQFDNVKDAIRRLQEYERTGNVEFLVDVANLALVEFVIGTHPMKHLSSSDDGQHVPLK